MALSLYRVLGVTLYFSKGFLEAAARVLAVAEVLQLLEVTVICFLDRSPTCSLLHHNRSIGCF